MEVIKKTKKIKKRRRRSKDNKAEEPITDIQVIGKSNFISFLVIVINLIYIFII